LIFKSARAARKAIGSRKMPLAAALKVLVVDDQFSVRQMTRMTLQELGIRHIHESENGKQGFQKAAGTRRCANCRSSC
jgi:PleD family two-component response regulator